MGKKLRPLVNWAAARGSTIPVAPVLSDSSLPWSAELQGLWVGIALEARALLAKRDRLPRLRDVSPNHACIAGDGRWRCFFLYGYGERIDANCTRAPLTAELASRIPGLNLAFFSILEPGAVIPAHRGVTKGLLTWHLGLLAPRRPEDCWMRVADQRVHWRHGEAILFDDTHDHEVRNDTDDYRVILLVQVERPMRYPYRLLPDLFLWAVKRSTFVQDARNNLDRIERITSELDRA